MSYINFNICGVCLLISFTCVLNLSLFICTKKKPKFRFTFAFSTYWVSPWVLVQLMYSYTSSFSKTFTNAKLRMCKIHSQLFFSPLFLIVEFLNLQSCEPVWWPAGVNKFFLKFGCNTMEIGLLCCCVCLLLLFLCSNNLWGVCSLTTGWILLQRLHFDQKCWCSVITRFSAGTSC